MATTPVAPSVLTPIPMTELASGALFIILSH